MPLTTGKHSIALFFNCNFVSERSALWSTSLIESILNASFVRKPYYFLPVLAYATHHYLIISRRLKLPTRGIHYSRICSDCRQSWIYRLFSKSLILLQWFPSKYTSTIMFESLFKYHILLYKPCEAQGHDFFILFWLSYLRTYTSYDTPLIYKSIIFLLKSLILYK